MSRARSKPSQTSRAPFVGKRVLVTAGPTREYIDDVRFLSNASTGSMGIELARGLLRRGAEVVLVLGPTQLTPPSAARIVSIVSTQDLLAAVTTHIEDCDMAIFSAAPSDYRPRRRRKGKPAREGGDLTLALRSTPDVAAAAGRRKGTRIHIGFALESGGGVERARGKLVKKRFDAIVLNGPANFGAGGGEAHWITPTGTPASLPTHSKAALARAILDHTARL